MNHEQAKRLKQLEVEMRDVCAEMTKARTQGKTEDELWSLFYQRAEGR